MASSAAPVQVIIYGSDLATLAEMGEQVRALADEIPGFVQASTSWAMTLPQLHIEVDRTRAQELGLTAEEIANQAYYALKGGLTNEYYRLDNMRLFTILLRYKGDQRKDRQDLEQVNIVEARRGGPARVAGPPRRAARGRPSSSTTTSGVSARSSASTGKAGPPAWTSRWIC